MEPSHSSAEEVGGFQMGGQVCDWGRGLEESVEHTVAFMGLYVPFRKCGAANVLLFAEMVSGPQYRAASSLGGKCERLRR